MPFYSAGRKAVVIATLMVVGLVAVFVTQRPAVAVRAKAPRADVSRPGPVVDTKNPLSVDTRGTGTVTVPVGFTKVTPDPLLSSKIQNIIVIYQENWSFDALYAKYPTANGAFPGSAAATAASPQVDVFNAGQPLTSVPQPLNQQVPNNFNTPLVVDPNFPPGSFDFKPYTLPATLPTLITGDIIHRFYTEQGQIDGGKNETSSCRSPTIPVWSCRSSTPPRCRKASWR